MKKTPFTSIRSRIILYTAIIIILFGTVLGSLVFSFIFSQSEYNLIRESETSLLYVVSSINDNVDSIRSYIQSSKISKHITSYAMDLYPSDNATRKDAHEFLQDTYAANSSLRNTMIRVVALGNNRNDIVQTVESAYSSPIISKETLISQPFFKQSVIDEENPTCGIILDPFLPTHNVEMVPFVFTIHHPYRADDIGYIFTEMSISSIIQPIVNSMPDELETYYVRMGEKLYIYDQNTLIETNEPLFDDVSFDSANFTMIEGKNINKKKVFAIAYPLKVNDWYVVKCIDASGIYKDMSSVFIYMLLLVLAFSVLIGLLFYRVLSKMVNIPVQKLTERIERIEKGDFSRDEQTEWNNELGDIGRTINNLSENVFSLMNQRIEDEKQKKDYEYQILQSQINPHFLYNTLNSIKWMATIQNAPGIAEMTTALSRLLKEISKGADKIISLDHELALANDYFTIQKYRYGGTISLETDIENEQLLKCNILRFTLQPLIENAIFHGIEPKGTSGTISIKVYQKDDVFIEVRDDGVGMSEKEANDLLSDDHNAKSSFFKEIGISNVNKRLQYEFGEKYGLSIDSAPNEYTVVKICIPFTEKEVPLENLNS